MNSRDVHDESTVDSLPCLLLDICGNAVLNAYTSSKMSCLVFDIRSICGIEHNLRSLELHVVLKSIIFRISIWYKMVIDFFCFLIKSLIIVDFFAYFKTCFIKLEMKNAFASHKLAMRKSILSPGVASGFVVNFGGFL